MVTLVTDWSLKQYHCLSANDLWKIAMCTIVWLARPPRRLCAYYVQLIFVTRYHAIFNMQLSRTHISTECDINQTWVVWIAAAGHTARDLWGGVHGFLDTDTQTYRHTAVTQCRHTHTDTHTCIQTHRHTDTWQQLNVGTHTHAYRHTDIDTWQ